MCWRPRSVAAFGEAAVAPGYRGELRDGAPVELALASGDPERVLEIARECAQAGTQALAVLSGGFADAGDAGRARLAALLAVCRAGGMRLVGPNCLGVFNTDPAIAAHRDHGGRRPAGPGAIALASQSSAIGIAAIAEARRRGLGLSSFASTGDKADLSGNDFLQYWEQDDDTAWCCCTSSRSATRAASAQIARRVAASKPIVAVKTGRSAAGARPRRRHRRACSAPPT